MRFSFLEAPMKPLTTLVCAAAVTLLAGCAGDGTYYGGSYYGGYGGGYYGANYYDCDYYSPPWGYPDNYCQYQVWNQPVFYGGIWYGGPIYYRTYSGANWYWLQGGWRRDNWRGARPRIDWNRGGNRQWRGEMRRGRDGNRGPGRSANDIPPDNDGTGNRPPRNRDGGFRNNRGGNNAGENNAGENIGPRPGGRRQAEAGPPPDNDGAGNTPAPDRGAGFGDNPRRNNGGNNNVSRPGGQRDAGAGPPPNERAANNPPPNRGGGTRNNAGRNNGGGNQGARPARQRDASAGPRANRGGAFRNVRRGGNAGVNNAARPARQRGPGGRGSRNNDD